jgi:hypothetical protein
MEEQRALFDHLIPWCTRCPAVFIGLLADQPIGVRSDSTFDGYLPTLGSNLAWDVGMRSNIITLHYQDNASPQERAYVSALCGGISGGVVTRVMGM